MEYTVKHLQLPTSQRAAALPVSNLTVGNLEPIALSHVKSVLDHGLCVADRAMAMKGPTETEDRPY